MNVGNKHYRTVWLDENDDLKIIDQRQLPFEFVLESLNTVQEVAGAIKDMQVRGAGCIGATAGYGMLLACQDALASDNFEACIRDHASTLKETRPTAINLAWAVDRQLKDILHESSPEAACRTAKTTALTIADEDAEWCRRIGEHGLKIIQALAADKKDPPVNILTHCNAGWLAFVDYGSATAPIYAAHDAGIPVHVWVDETRPRNQGARLTAWELGQHGVPHTVIADNTGGHLMQRGLVDMLITGTDRTSCTGDVANKIGTYLKALAAKDNNIPFYVALPSSTFDWEIEDGLAAIPIEERNPDEVKKISGLVGEKEVEVLLTPKTSAAANYAFDVTPARLVTGLITERGVCGADKASIARMFPDLAR